MVPTTSHKIDYLLLATVILLLLIGIATLSSVSVFFARENVANQYYFLTHQLLFGFLPGILAAGIAYLTPLQWLRRLSLPALLLTLVLLVLVFVPMIGHSESGAQRWIGIGGITYQPAELLKVTFFLYLAAWLSSRAGEGEQTSQRRKTSSSHTLLHSAYQSLLPFLAIMGIVAGLLIAQPDMSTLGVIAIAALAMYFAANTPVWHTLVIAGGGVGAAALLIITSGYRMERLSTYLQPGAADPLGAGYQVKQAMIAIGSGGLTGKGLGLSQQKLGFVPQPLSDSIFAIFAEEAGFIGAAFLLLLFGIFLW